MPRSPRQAPAIPPRPNKKRRPSRARTADGKHEQRRAARGGTGQAPSPAPWARLAPRAHLAGDVVVPPISAPISPQERFVLDPGSARPPRRSARAASALPAGHAGRDRNPLLDAALSPSDRSTRSRARNPPQAIRGDGFRPSDPRANHDYHRRAQPRRGLELDLVGHAIGLEECSPAFVAAVPHCSGPMNSKVDLWPRRRFLQRGQAPTGSPPLSVIRCPNGCGPGAASALPPAPGTPRSPRTLGRAFFGGMAEPPQRPAVCGRATSGRTPGPARRSRSAFCAVGEGRAPTSARSRGRGRPAPVRSRTTRTDST